MRLRLPNFGLTELFKNWVAGSRDNDSVNMLLYDRTLLWLTFGLAIVGFVMVTSASMPIGQRLADDPFLFAKRDALYLGLAFGLSMVTLRIPMEVWQRYSNVMLLMSIVMLLIVLVVGSSVNGASRWIALGPLRIQPAELSKLSLFCYLASYLVRKVEEVRTNFWGFCSTIVHYYKIAFFIVKLTQNLRVFHFCFQSTIFYLFIYMLLCFYFIISLSS